ncbi:hypothetical protein H4W34_004601 [Actinomadura algeriensis]|uniref:Uncharacterized protein n=1 Tax=Actinomadura algeriensis TaxID=1679523 RepID=A0ABR9JWJ4_9ACTN|nr:hypothetical protein [Actinomadura algeriensis]
MRSAERVNLSSAARRTAVSVRGDGLSGRPPVRALSSRPQAPPRRTIPAAHRPCLTRRPTLPPAPRVRLHMPFAGPQARPPAPIEHTPPDQPLATSVRLHTPFIDRHVSLVGPCTPVVPPSAWPPARSVRHAGPQDRPHTPTAGHASPTVAPATFVRLHAAFVDRHAFLAGAHTPPVAVPVWSPARFVRPRALFAGPHKRRAAASFSWPHAPLVKFDVAFVRPRAPLVKFHAAFVRPRPQLVGPRTADREARGTGRCGVLRPRSASGVRKVRRGR